MQDRIPLYPGRVKMTPVAGHENTYDMVRADEPQQEGTPLNKNSLLKDSTAAALGLTESAVPDDALLALLQASNFLSDAISGGLSVDYQTYVGSGTYGSGNPTRLTFGGKPMVVFISGEKDSSRYYGARLMRGMTDYNTGTTYGGVVTWGDNYVEFYHTSSALYQHNYDGKTYHVACLFQPKQFDGMVSLTVFLPDGTPASGCKIDGVYTKLGTSILTDANGKASGFAKSGETVTISNDKYIDLADISFALPNMSDTVVDLTKTFEHIASGEIRTILVSRTVIFSSDTDVTVSLVGGGSGGDAGGRGWNIATSSGVTPEPGAGGAGGDGGKILNFSLSAKAGETFSCIIGSGGSGGIGSNSGPAAKGTAGGNTTFGPYTSANGDISNYVFGDSSIVAGGNGGNGAAGMDRNGAPPSGENGTRNGGKGGTGGHIKLSGGDANNAIGIGGGGGGGGGGGAGYSSDGFGFSSGGSGGRGYPGAIYIKF